MGYAAAGYCFDTGQEATAALTAAQQAKYSLGGGQCPLTWNTAGYALIGSYNTSTHDCAVTADRLYFSSCSEPGALAPSVIADPIGDSTAFYTVAFGLLASIWAVKRIYSLFNKDA